MRSFAATSSLRSVPSGMPIDVFVNETFDDADDDEQEVDEQEVDNVSTSRPTSADAGRNNISNNELETLAPPIRKATEVRCNLLQFGNGCLIVGARPSVLMMMMMMRERDLISLRAFPC